MKRQEKIDLVLKYQAEFATPAERLSSPSTAA